jgi:D-glycero-D-manno-heptose 1,7-bisphosphate phosphatase
MTIKLVVLTRDGVINQDTLDYVKSPEAWKPLPGSLEAIAALNRAGIRVAVATNESGISRGLFDIDQLTAIHCQMHDELEKVGGQVDMVLFCPHAPSDDCDCRKPRPGMLQQIAERALVDLSEITLIGVCARDLQAALTAGARPVLILSEKGEKDLLEFTRSENIPVFGDLPSAVHALLKGHPGTR